MGRASWATLTLAGVDELGRQLQVTERFVVLDHDDATRSLLVPWWPQWSLRVGAWTTCPN